MIVIVDYGMGNSASIRNMLSRIGVESMISDSEDAIASAEKLVLPGVGAFDEAMTNLEARRLVPVLEDRVLRHGVPILGICLGMQLFSRSSEEGRLPGLGWIDAETIRFRFSEGDPQLRIPHMGWNRIEVARSGSVLDGIAADSRFYFVHSYHVRCRSATDVLSTTAYGLTFHSAVVRDNIIGTQFHPEKSHKFGLRVLGNFVKMS